MQLRPTGDNIVVKIHQEEEVSVSGLIIPGTEEKKGRGEVLAVGPGRTLENGQRAAMDVKAGDQILFKKYAPDEITIKGVQYHFVKNEDVIAVIE